MPTNPTIDQLLASLPPAQRDALMNEATREAARRERKQSALDYATPDGIIRFARDILHADPAPYQERIMRSLVEKRRVCVRAPHGAGKSALASWCVWWGLYALGDDTKVITTASVWRQLEKYLWVEVSKWGYRGSFETRPRILNTSIKFDDMTTREAMAIASDNPYLLEGAHADSILIIMDESKAIPDDMFDALEGAMSTGNAYALMLSTPGVPSGRFYDIQSRKPGYEDWTAEHIALEECIAAGRINPKWAADRAKQWGENSAVYLNRVKGEFADSGEDALIPLSWVEAANERWLACQGKGKEDANTAYGVDVARYGEDKTVICRVVGNVLESLSYHSQQSTMETAGKVAATVGRDTPVGVDVIGVGAGVADRLTEQDFNVIPVNVAEAARDASGNPLHDRTGHLEFINKRSLLWWMLRDALNPENPEPLSIPPDDRLTGDLTAPKWGYNSNGKIVVESKDDLRKRLGRSTDAADALALALYAQDQGSEYDLSGFLTIDWW